MKSCILGTSPPRSRSPLRSYSPPRGAPLERERIRDYSPGARRPNPYDSTRGGPPMKRSRPDDGPMGRPLRDGPPRGIVRDGAPRDSVRGPPRESGRGGGGFRR